MNTQPDVDWIVGSITTEAIGTIISKYFTQEVSLQGTLTQTGRHFCDQHGIPRKSNIVKIGHLTARKPDMYRIIVCMVEENELSSLGESPKNFP